MDKLPNSFKKENRVRCFSHTTQLSATALVGPFNAGMGSVRNNELLGAMESDADNDNDTHVEMAELDDDDDDDDEAGTEGETDETNNDPEDGINELDELDEEERNRILEDTKIVRACVSKLRNLSFAIINSTTLALPAWLNICAKHGLKRRLMPRDVVTRWNSTFDMLQFALKYRKAIDAITAERTLKLRKHELEPEDWLIVEDLTAVLGQYKNATLYFSSDAASISAVIPAMDRIDSHLNAHAGNRSLHPSIIAAMKLAKLKLNRYYSLTDMSSIYRIAMSTVFSCSCLCQLTLLKVLHPGLKLEYFRQHEWEADWIEAAEDLLRQEYSLHYENDEVTTPEDDAGQSTGTSVADFGNISVAQPSKITELDRYLRDPVENAANPLMWWVKNRLTYPKLSRMALDYLSVPASSTAVERVFSLGRRLLPFTRCGLSAATMRTYLCLGSWCRCDLVSVDVLYSAIKESKGRKRKHVSSGVEDTMNA
jgi:hypothetical protein